MVKQRLLGELVYIQIFISLEFIAFLSMLTICDLQLTPEIYAMFVVINLTAYVMINGILMMTAFSMIFFPFKTSSAINTSDY